MLLERQRDNPRFRFLFDAQSKENIYYKWKVFSLSRGESDTQLRLSFSFTQNFSHFSPSSPLSSYLSNFSLLSSPHSLFSLPSFLLVFSHPLFLYSDHDLNYRSHYSDRNNYDRNNSYHHQRTFSFSIGEREKRRSRKSRRERRERKELRGESGMEIFFGEEGGAAVEENIFLQLRVGPGGCSIWGRRKM